MDPRKAEALFSWIAIIWLIAYILLSFAILDLWWAFVGVAALVIISFSMISRMNIYEVMPFEFIVLLMLPLYIQASGHWGMLSDSLELWNDLLSLTSVMAYSVIGLFLTAELQAFTDLKMNRTFAVSFIMVFSLAVSCIWSVFEYLSDSILGTELLSGNYDLMLRFLYAAIGGILMGLFFALYLRLMPDSRLERFGLDSLQRRNGQ